MTGADQSPKQKLSTADHRMHRELSTIWTDIDKDPDTHVVIIRGEGKGLSAGTRAVIFAKPAAPPWPRPVSV